jgi:hypothetical protein
MTLVQIWRSRSTAAYGSMALAIKELWWNIYKPMNDLEYAPSYIDEDGNPHYFNSYDNDFDQ